MPSSAFDWKMLIASDPRYAAQDTPGPRIADGSPGDAWKTKILAAYFRDDQLRDSTRDAETRVGLVPALVGTLKVIGGAIFGMKVKGSEVPAADIVIGPGEHALVVRDGRILGTFTQARLQHGQGFLPWLQGLVGATHNYQLLLVDAAPFEISVGLGTDGGAHTLLTKDKHVLSGRATVRMQFDVEHLENVVGLMRGRTLLDRTTVARLIAEPLFARVLVPAAADHLASEVRGNVGLQDKIRADATTVLEAAFRPVGLMVRGLDVSFEVTAEDRQAMAEAAKNLEASRKEKGAERARDDFRRSYDVGAYKKELVARDRQIEERRARIAEQERLVHELELQRKAATTTIEGEQNALAVEKIRMEIQQLKAEQGLLLRERSQAIERHDLEERRRIDRDDVLAREDSRRRTVIETEVERAKAYGALNSEQILAMQAAASPEAARALAEKYRAQAAESSRTSEKLEDLVRRQGDVVHKMATDYGEQMAGVARVASGNRGGTESGPAIVCGSCGAVLKPGWRVCPTCAADVKPLGRA